jgi:hypothetical protein
MSLSLKSTSFTSKTAMGNPNRFEGQTLAKQCSDVEGQRIDFSMK